MKDSREQLLRIDTQDYEFALKGLELPDNGDTKILDVGSGFGRASIAAEKLGIKTRIFQLDLNFYQNTTMRESAKDVSSFRTSGQTNLLSANVLQMPFADNAFDGVIILGSYKTSSTLLKREIIREIVRVAKGSIAIDDTIEAKNQFEFGTYKTVLEDFGYKVSITKEFEFNVVNVFKKFHQHV